MLEVINERYMKFLFEIDNRTRNISELAKIADLTLSVASILISRWARDGVVLKTRADEQRGKIILISLTDYGKKQVNLLKELYLNSKEKEKVNGGEK